MYVMFVCVYVCILNIGAGFESPHFGKWDNIDVNTPDSYARAAEQMTDYMFSVAQRIRGDSNKVQSYIDLGSGDGSSAIRLAKQNPNLFATCLNASSTQNIQAEKAIQDVGLTERIDVVLANYEEIPTQFFNTYDVTLSQDAFIHATSKKAAYQQAYNCAKPGGVFIFCDMMSSETKNEETKAFAEFLTVNDWLSPQENIQAVADAGWADVEFIDLSVHIKKSYLLMLNKIRSIIGMGLFTPEMDALLLDTYENNLLNRISQVDRGVFKWGIIQARKPVSIYFLSPPPIPFKSNSSLVKETDDYDGSHVVVIDILKKMSKQELQRLQSGTYSRTLVTMSSGLDHVDMSATRELGITVLNSGKSAITDSVVDYVLTLTIAGLRDILPQLKVPFPEPGGWNLTWNANGVGLDAATVGVIGAGPIVQGFIRKLANLNSKVQILYTAPEQYRIPHFEAEFPTQVRFVSSGVDGRYLKNLASIVDVLVPLPPLTEDTKYLIDESVFAFMSPTAGLINCSRGAVVNNEALVDALRSGQIKYAILDTTAPEPLPANHPLLSINNCYVLPHYATNTTSVRKALVEDINELVIEEFKLSSTINLEKQEFEARRDLAVAHRACAMYKMDMLCWNHISALVGDELLITPGKKMWSLITPRDIVKTSTNCTADLIHNAIYEARSDVKAIIHLHTPNACAVACLEMGFIPLTQDGAYFHERVGLYEWDGVSNESEEHDLIRDAVIACGPKCNTLLMNNHGFTCFGSSVKEVWVLAFYFERCCEVQLNCLKTGQKIKYPNPKVMAKAAEASFLENFAPGVQEWEGICDLFSGQMDSLPKRSKTKSPGGSPQETQSKSISPSPSRLTL